MRMNDDNLSVDGLNLSKSIESDEIDLWISSVYCCGQFR